MHGETTHFLCLICLSVVTVFSRTGLCRSLSLMSFVKSTPVVSTELLAGIVREPGEVIALEGC